MENVHDHQLSIDEMAFLAGTLFEAGSDTVDPFPCCPTNGLSGNPQTADAIIVMTMAAACFPDAQVRVQQELDMVVGMDRCKLARPPIGRYRFILL